MNKFQKLIKLLFSKKKYLEDLCDKYGNAEDVRDHLLEVITKYPFLSCILKDNIEELNLFIEREIQLSIIDLETSSEPRGGCYDCPYGNGEGGCTIPYCNWK